MSIKRHNAILSKSFGFAGKRLKPTYTKSLPFSGSIPNARLLSLLRKSVIAIHTSCWNNAKQLRFNVCETKINRSFISVGPLVTVSRESRYRTDQIDLTSDEVKDF
ncbi:unnamed protein product [Clavelina lepadiformis]|uniref:Uncharacterized protein n=1 Tax=Clavelina lepadiformis TaxID=159417 RepID=A0ABP0GT62_CLALP